MNLNKKPIKKIIILASFAPSVVNFRGTLIGDLQNQGFRVYVVIPHSSSKEEIDTIEQLGVKVFCVNLCRNDISPLTDLYTIFSLYRIFRKVRPDTVFSYTAKPVIYGGLAARLAKVTNIISLISGLGYLFINSNKRSQRIFFNVIKKLYSLSLSASKVVFFQNPDDKNLFLDKKIIKCANKCVVVNGSGVDIKHFSKQPLPPRVSFLMIARLLKDKGVYEYIEAAKLVQQRYPNIEFKLAGWIDSNPAAISPEILRKWQKEKTISFLGGLTDVRPALKDASVFVLPSYREGTPRTVLEAMASGRAIITTDAPGCRETVINGENGFLVPVKNVKALAGKMIYLIENRMLLEQMAIKSRKIATDKYDVNKVNGEILKYINE